MIIYKYTNIHNGKSYIGQTVNTAYERAGGPNLKHYKGSKKFYNAIKAYTADGSNITDHFALEILEKNIDDIEEANALERYWIAEYDAIENGYNILPGGQIDNSNLFRKIYEIDVNKNILGEYKSAAHANRELFPELGFWHAREITKCCENSRGNASGKYFCYKDEYDCYKIQHDAQSFNVVLQLDAEKRILNRFTTLTAAARYAGVTPAGIHSCCTGSYKTCAKSFWCFEVDYNKFIPQIPKTKPYAHGVIQIDKITGKTLATFDSATLAAEATGISRGNISTCCRGKLKSAGGFLWKFTT